MSEPKRRCQAKTHLGRVCGRELYDDEHCIFHSTREDKDVELFAVELKSLTMQSRDGILDLTGFVFPEGVTIDPAGLQQINFYNSVFLCNPRFNQQVIIPSLMFGNANFKVDVKLEHMRFVGDVQFAGAVFQGEAWFRSSMFESETHINATFKEQACFSDATFLKEISFSESRFKKIATFYQTEFKKTSKCKFERTTFESACDFRSCHFLGDTVFRDCLSKGDTVDKIDFRDARIAGSFKLTEEADPTAVIRHEVDLRNIKLLKPNTVKFEKINLSRFRITGTDVREIEFVAVEWDRQKQRERILDEVNPDPDLQRPEYALIAQAYGRLRANYEQALNYPSAGDFYIGEMEMRRRIERSTSSKIALTLYRWLSNYGESWVTPLIWSFSTILFFAIGYLFVGLSVVSPLGGISNEAIIQYAPNFSSWESLISTLPKLSDFGRSFLHSCSVFLRFAIRTPRYIATNEVGYILSVVESVLGPTLIALLLLALRRRFKR